jgi:hypothetical protein
VNHLVCSRLPSLRIALRLATGVLTVTAVAVTAAGCATAAGQRGRLASISVPGSFPGGVTSVAATSASNAWAAGCSRGKTILRHWDGGVWRVAASPAGLGCGSDLAVPVVVTSPGGGTWVFSSTDAASFASRRTGRSWTRPARFAATSTIRAAAAAGPDDVWVFGVRLGSLFAVRYDGTSWTSAPLPGVMAADASATSAHDVWVVGAAGSGLDLTASRWNGRTWDLLSPLRLPPGGQAITDLVDAVSPDDVWAAASVGTAGNGPLIPQIAHWNGRTWQPVSYPYGPRDGIDPGASAIAPDGTGGIWLAIQDHWLAHLHSGRWTLISTPFMIQALAWIPGTRSVWAAGPGGIVKYSS